MPRAESNGWSVRLGFANGWANAADFPWGRMGCRCREVREDRACPATGGRGGRVSVAKGTFKVDAVKAAAAATARPQATVRPVETAAPSRRMTVAPNLRHRLAGQSPRPAATANDRRRTLVNTCTAGSRSRSPTSCPRSPDACGARRRRLVWVELDPQARATVE